jgi:hypothetical protein
MEGKVFGIPLVLIILIACIIMPIGALVIALHGVTVQSFNKLDREINEINVTVKTRLVTPTLTLSPTEEATPTPTKIIKKAEPVK